MCKKISEQLLLSLGLIKCYEFFNQSAKRL